MAKEQDDAFEASGTRTDPTYGTSVPATGHDIDDDPWANPAACLRSCFEELLVVSDHPNRLAIAAHVDLALTKLVKERDDAVQAASLLWAVGAARGVY